MAQFADATISILTEDEDSSENESYSRTEPETESRDAERPMIGRLTLSRGSADGQSDERDGLLGIIRNGGGNSKYQQDVGVSGSIVQSMKTGSSSCLGTSLSPTTLLVICLLIAAFTVHFPSILLPNVGSTDVALRVSVCLAIVGAIASSMTSQLAFRMADSNFRSLLVGSCVGVIAFAVIRCFRTVPVAVLGVGSFFAGFLLTGVRVVVAGEYCRQAPSLSSLLDGDGQRPRRTGVDAATYLACGILVTVYSGVAPFISASLYLVFLATYPSSATDTDLSVTSPLVTSSVTLLPISNATLSFNDVAATNLSYWSNTSDDASTSSMATAIITSSRQSATSSYISGLQALSICYVVCSLGALLLALYTFEDDRSRKDKSPWTVSGVGRLVLGPLNAFRRQDVALLSPLALFVGAQQLFAYFAFIQVS